MKDPTTEQHIMEEAIKMVKEKLQAKLVEMFSKPKPTLVQMEGDDLYILDTIFDVWPDDETRGKSAKLIAEITQGKIRDYSRIYDEYEYKNGDYNYTGQGQMRFIFHFQKPTNY